MRYKWIAGLITILQAIILSGCAAMTEHRTGVVDESLTDCPQWPRCVSSQEANSDKQVPPLVLRGDVTVAWQQVQAAVADMSRTEIVDMQDAYLRAEVTSPWGVYTDDLELLLQREQGLIQLRSSARIGYYDFKVNRKRVEALRAELVERGVVEP